MRGYDVAAIVLADGGYGNHDAIKHHVAHQNIPVFVLPRIPENSFSVGDVGAPTMDFGSATGGHQLFTPSDTAESRGARPGDIYDWLRDAAPQFDAVLVHLARGGVENTHWTQIGRARMTRLQGECSYKRAGSVRRSHFGRVLAVEDPTAWCGGTARASAACAPPRTSRSPRCGRNK